MAACTGMARAVTGSAATGTASERDWQPQAEVGPLRALASGSGLPVQAEAAPGLPLRLASSWGNLAPDRCATGNSSEEPI